MPLWSDGRAHPNSYESPQYRVAMKTLLAKLDSQLATERQKREQLLADLAAAPEKAQKAHA